MGGGGSSSMRKSSKRKRDKIHSQRQKKESKKRRRIYDSASSYSDDDSINSGHSSSSNSKSHRRRRIKKNKKRLHDYSMSPCSDDHSTSSDSDSLTACEGGNKHRQARRSRPGLKSRKTRDKKKLASPNSDAEANNARKRKRLRKDHVVKPKKKSSKKRSRKHLSSSSSSESESCSTCQSSGSGSADGKHQRSKVILNKKIKLAKGSVSFKSPKKHEARSTSCSLYGGDGDHNVSVGLGDGALAPVSNPRRLKSVIAIADHCMHDRGENRWEKDAHKDEIVCIQDDYPSPQSLDSNDGGSKMESENDSHGASSKRICVENVAGEEVTELGKSGSKEGDQNDAGDHQSDEAHLNNFKDKEAGLSVPVVALGGDDLESILRQKALENFRKFHGGLPTTGPRSTDPKMNNKSGMNGSSVRSVQTVQNKSTKQDSPKTGEMNGRNGPSLKRDFLQLADIQKLPDGKEVEDDAVAELTAVHQPDEASLSGGSNENISISSNAVLSKSILKRDTSPEAGATNACSSSVELTSAGLMAGDQSFAQQNKAKDSSQFEQKTMSVMRGGEMVQVSYKVYIPKKSPALARRQLRR